MTTVVVIGDALLDRDVLGRVDRVCPDAPVPVVDVERVVERPGGAALAALMLATAAPETDVVLAAGIGRDEAGRRVRSLLRDRVRVHDVSRPSATPAKTRVRVAGQSLLRLDDAGVLLDPVDPVDPADGGLLGSRPDEPLDAAAVDAAAVDAAAVDAAALDAAALDAAALDAAALDALLATADAVLVADYGGEVARHPQVRSVLTRHVDRVPVVWDPHPRGEQPVAGVAVATPNRSEATAAGGGSAVADDLGRLAERLRLRWSARAVCVTDGERGAVTAVAGAVPLRARGPRVAGPVDACGAGDRFAVAVTLALVGGATAHHAVATAVREVSAWLAAGGVASVMASTGDDGLDAVADPRSAEAVVAAVRSRGGTVVATGGCFDVLHAGHLASLQAARALGDCLVVLVNSDASVRRLKGPGRPVHAAADRARLIEALSCVDAVAVFEDDDPTDTLDRLRPDVWVKSGDYSVEDLPEAETVTRHGGRVVLVPYLDGHSTTSILAGLDV